MLSVTFKRSSTPPSPKQSKTDSQHCINSKHAHQVLFLSGNCATILNFSFRKLEKLKFRRHQQRHHPLPNKTSHSKTTPSVHISSISPPHPPFNFIQPPHKSNLLRKHRLDNKVSNHLPPPHHSCDSAPEATDFTHQAELTSNDRKKATSQ